MAAALPRYRGGAALLGETDMKRLYTMLAAIGCAIAAQAALDTRTFDAAVAFPAQTVAAGATVTNAAQAVVGCKGLGEITFNIGAVASASSARTVTATLYGTNTVAGGWAVVNAATYTGAAAGVLRLPFNGRHLPPFIKVAAGVTTADTAVAGTLMAAK